MDPITQQTALATAGAAGGDPVYVDDLFSTHLYEGTGSNLTITNGIDLAGEGGLVWIKSRDTSAYHSLTDTVRGVNKDLITNDAFPEQNQSSNPSVRQFNSDGFGVGTEGRVNIQNYPFVSWTFRKQEKFFDIVTWNGNGTNGRTVSHNLGSVPGMILIKSTDTSTYWIVYHRSLGAGHYMILNDGSTKSNYDSGNSNSRYFNNTAPTSTEFTLSDDGWVNGSGRSYVAYIFAHNEASFGENNDEAIIHCGSYTGTGGGTPQLVNLGFEPQFVMVKNTTTSDNWSMHDVMRGSNVNHTYRLKADGAVAEAAWSAPFNVISSRGFIPTANNGEVNASGDVYIYIAIARSHKPPEAGTEVFSVSNKYQSESSNSPSYSANFAPDVWFRRNNITTNSQPITVLWRQTMATMKTHEIGGTETDHEQHRKTMQYMNGAGDYSSHDYNDYKWMFARRKGAFDVVAYTGNGSNYASHPHNLGKPPELKIIRRRDDPGFGLQPNWIVGGTALNGTGNDKYLLLNSSAGEVTSSNYWFAGSDTATGFSVKGGNYESDSQSGGYVAMLFATVPNVSKVGTYTFQGSDIDVDCGFTTGARFVMIKRLDASGEWCVFDSLRGITNSASPKLAWGTQDAHDANASWIKPYSGGFRVLASGGNDVSDQNGSRYLFLAFS